jgi:hypothetical protein
MTAMLKKAVPELAELPLLRVDVAEHDVRSRKGWVRCAIGENLHFNTASMETYFFAQWEPVLYDALLVAAAAEFCDRTKRRPAHGWGRDIELRIPVHEPARWSAKSVVDALHGALEFLTGDAWGISFYPRNKPVDRPDQGMFSLPSGVSAVIPFSNGLDSRAVAGLVARKLGDSLVRVRLGSKDLDGTAHSRKRQPFTAVPYKVLPGKSDFVESSARSRGFKFALISGLAAYLSGAGQVIVPESGQGALGPTLIPVGQAYADYRSHPLFTGRMEKLLTALLGHRVQFVFPQIWHTKGETLKNFVSECEEGPSWANTWSCWQQNRQASVEGKKRQCGICAACMLRRMSVHAAGLDEPGATYVWENLGASQFEAGAATAFDRSKITRAMREYAIGGTLHFDHLAAVRHSAANAPMLGLSVYQLSRACDLSEAETRVRLDRMLDQHESEWKEFVRSLGPTSFVAEWALHAR